MTACHQAATDDVYLTLALSYPLPQTRSRWMHWAQCWREASWEPVIQGEPHFKQFTPLCPLATWVCKFPTGVLRHA